MKHWMCYALTALAFLVAAGLDLWRYQARQEMLAEAAETTAGERERATW